MYLMNFQLDTVMVFDPVKSKFPGHSGILFIIILFVILVFRSNLCVL